MTTLKLGPDLALSEDAFFQPWGILAMRGAGKTNAASVMAEELWEAGHPFVAIDPVGSWWGLRAGPAGQPNGGLAIPILGGDHGDIPLEEAGGQAIADFLVDERASAVVDVSALGENAKHRFLTDFTERLFRRNTEPLVVFLEEADDYAPQRPGKGPALATLGAMQRLVKRGRFKGLTPVMITQRSAAINKDLLTQIENLVVLRSSSPQDRKAIEGWVTYHGQSKEILESMSGLEDGEAWLWSPHALSMLKRFTFRMRHTFDSGATPKGGKGARRSATLADVDLGELQKRMASTIEKAKAEDPRELRRQIAELKRQVAKAPASPQIQIERVEVPVEVSVLTDDDRIVLKEAMAALSTAGDAMTGLEARLNQLVFLGSPQPSPRAPIRPQRPVAPQPRPERRASRDAPAEPVGDLHVTRAHQRILDTLAWLAGVGLSPANRTQVAFLSGYTPNSGGFNNYLGALRSAGLIDYPSSGMVGLTDAGQAIADGGSIPATTEALHDALFSKLGASKARILQALIDAYPDALTRADLAEGTGFTANSGGFNNYLGSMRSLGLIDYPNQGYVAALPVLFLDA